MLEFNFLENNSVYDRSDRLTEDRQHGESFAVLLNVAYCAATSCLANERRKKYGRGHQDSVEGQSLAQKLSEDITSRLSKLEKVSPVFQETVNASLPAIQACVAEYLEHRINEGKLYGPCFTTERLASINVMDVVGKNLGL